MDFVLFFLLPIIIVHMETRTMFIIALVASFVIWWLKKRFYPSEEEQSACEKTYFTVEDVPMTYERPDLDRTMLFNRYQPNIEWMM